MAQRAESKSTSFNYLCRALLDVDERNYKAAGVLALRRVGTSWQVLLGAERARGNALSALGGKRDKGEKDSAFTAAREFAEESGGYCLNSSSTFNLFALLGFRRAVEAGTSSRASRAADNAAFLVAQRQILSVLAGTARHAV